MRGVEELRTCKGLIYSLFKNEYRNLKLTKVHKKAAKVE
jgi:hypothetical protein